MGCGDAGGGLGEGEGVPAGAAVDREIGGVVEGEAGVPAGGEGRRGERGGGGVDADLGVGAAGEDVDDHAVDGAAELDLDDDVIAVGHGAALGAGRDHGDDGAVDAAEGIGQPVAEAGRTHGVLAGVEVGGVDGDVVVGGGAGAGGGGEDECEEETAHGGMYHGYARHAPRRDDERHLADQHHDRVGRWRAASWSIPAYFPRELEAIAARVAQSSAAPRRWCSRTVTGIT